MAQPVNHIKEERPVARDERSIGELFSELTRETTNLVRQEVQLAKTEMSAKAASVGKDIGFLAAGALVLYAGFLALIATVIIVLAYAMPWWAAALVVSAVVLAIGGFLVMRGITNLKHEGLAPTNTIQTLQEDARWAKEQTK